MMRSPSATTPRVGRISESDSSNFCLVKSSLAQGLIQYVRLKSNDWKHWANTIKKDFDLKMEENR